MTFYWPRIEYWLLKIAKLYAFSRACRKRERFRSLFLIFSLAQSGAWLMFRLLSQSTQRLRHVSCFINKQESLGSVYLSYFRCLAGLSNKDCLNSIWQGLGSNKRKIANKIINSSIYTGNWNAFEWIELQLHIFGNWVLMTVGEEGKNCEIAAIWSYIKLRGSFFSKLRTQIKWECFHAFFAFSIDSVDNRSAISRSRSLIIPLSDQRARSQDQAVSSNKNLPKNFNLLDSLNFI